MRDATKQVRDELTKRGVIWGKPAPEYWELLGGMPTTDCVTTVGGVNICETTAGALVVENLSPEQAIAAVLGQATCHDVGNLIDGGNEFCCSECGCVLQLYDDDGCNNLCTSFIFDYPRYCPECGRKVVSE